MKDRANEIRIAEHTLKMALEDNSLAVSEIFHSVERDIIRIINNLSRRIESIPPEYIKSIKDVAGRSKEDPDWMRGLAAQFILATIDRYMKANGEEEDEEEPEEKKEETKPKEGPEEKKEEPKEEKIEIKEEPEVKVEVEEKQEEASEGASDDTYTDIDKAVKEDIEKITSEGSAVEYLRQRLGGLDGIPKERIAHLIKQTL